MTGIDDLYGLVIAAPTDMGIAGVSLSGIEEEYSTLLDKMLAILNSKLSSEDGAKVEDLHNDLTTFSERSGFKAGFKVGVLLMTEVFAHE